jgi:2'-5' RNA ligase
MIHLLKGFLIMKRLFVAVKIKPGPDLLNTLYRLKKELQYEKINWVDEKNLHFTLKFLGKTDEAEVTTITKALENIAQTTQAIDIRIENLGIFGSRYDPRVIWAGIESSETLLALGENVLNKLDEAGFKRDRQNFVPHITLGRIKHIRDKKLLKVVIDRNKDIWHQNDRINSIYLYESILRPEGPQYKVVKTFHLQD